MSTNSNRRYWEDRKIDWEKAYWDTQDHPHRKMLIEILKLHPFTDILEIGCGAGENLNLIKKAFPNVNVSGCDINKDAIKLAKEKMPFANLKVGRATELPFHGGSFDIILTDACLIYVDPKGMDRVLREVQRVGSRRGMLMSIEFHSKNPLKRIGLRTASRYYAYDYEKLLANNYFKGIQIFKLGKEQWPGEPWETYGNLITAII